MGIVQKDGVRTMIISYFGMVLGYLNKGLLFILILSIEEIGLISILVSVGMLFAQFSNLGVTYSIWRFFPFFKNQKSRHNGFLPLVLLVVFSGFIVCTTLALVFRDVIELQYASKSQLFLDYYIWFIPIGIAMGLYFVFDVYLRSLYKTTVSVFALDIVLRLLLTILLILLFLDLISFHAFLVAHSLTFVVPAIILLIYLYRLGELNLSISTIRVSKRFRKILIQYSMFNFVNSLGAHIVNSLDILMIAQFYGLGPTGVYATTVFLTSVLQVPYRSIVRVSSPLISDYWKHREIDKMRELYVKVSSIGLLTGLSMFVLIWLNIDLLFSFLKPSFSSGIWVFFFLMIGRMLDMFFGLNGAIFSTSKKYKYDIIFTISLIFIVYFLNLLLLPWWGIAGAAISTAIALMVYNVGRVLFVWRVFNIHPFERNQFIIIGIGVATLLIGSIVGDLFDNKWLQMTLDCFLFFVAFAIPIYVFRLEPESINYTKKLIGLVAHKLFKIKG